MAGGQSGLSFIGEAGLAFGLLGFIGGCTARGFIDGGGGDDAPRDEANQQCEEAWVVANDGDDDTQNDTDILGQSWCIDHLAVQEAEVQQEQMEQVQEAQVP